MPPSKLVLEPESSIMRSAEFIQLVANAARAGKHSVVLNGSVLAHAFHQLLDLGVPIYSSRQPTRRRAIEKRIFGKLVRDKIPEIIVANGDAVTFGRVPRTEKRKLLISKAFEELAEIASAEDASRIGELADLYEVLDAILADFGITWASVINAAQEKKTQRGGFAGGIVLVGTNLPKPNESDLLPGGAGTRNEVRPDKALHSATKIETVDGEVSVPILNLLSNDDGIDVRVGDTGDLLRISIRLEGDRMMISRCLGNVKRRGKKSTDSPPDDLLF
jgi:predicted house-cleaning noncanonical NTP pyrophosphatase (MazG superfamily)